MCRPGGTTVLVAALALASTSCGGSAPKLYLVTGQVLVDGQPAEGATIVFHPKNSTPESLRPGAVVEKDGTFTLQTYPHGDGAPEGEYVVLVTWFEDPPPGKEGPESPKSKLPLRYADAAQTDLKATVKAGENKLEPFRLTKKK